MKSPEQGSLNIENSPLREVYYLLEGESPLGLSQRYTAEDQKIWKSGNWDYKNPDLIINKVKNILESTNENQLSADERKWQKEILWFWYHHAISCAITRYKDKKEAQEYAEKALAFQEGDHPNKITRLLSFLVNDRLEEAEKWAATIKKEPEKTSAQDLIIEYKRGDFF